MTAATAVAERSRVPQAAALAIAAWLTPAALDLAARSTLGASLFDWPWLALHFADVATAAGLLAMLAGAMLLRKAPDRAMRRTMMIGLAVAALVFGAAPVVKSASGLSSDVLLAGLLPTLDAESYLVGTLDFFRTGQLNEWSTRRPLATTQMAGIFALTGQDLRLTLFILAAGCAAAALLVAGRLTRAFGWVGACAGFASLFAFIYATLGSTMSESLGFTAGGVGFALLWLGAGERRPLPLLAGIALIGIGLNARAGAFFVLPMLALWMGWLFANGRGLNRRLHWGWAAAAIAAASVGFLATHLLIALIGAPGQLAFSNFAHTFYGLAVGGEPWTRVYIDAPHLVALPEGDQAKEIYRLAIAHALRSPLDPVIGVLSIYNEFLFNMRWHAYVPSNGLRLVILLLGLVGIVHVVRHRSEPYFALLLAGTIGIFLSVPFLGDGGSRVFAATHAFSAALVAAGAAAIHARLTRTAIAPDPGAEPRAILAIAALLAAAVLVPLPVALTVAAEAPAARADLACPEGENHLHGMAPRHGTVLICAAGTPCAEGVRVESLRRADVWKSPLVSSLSERASLRAATGIDRRNGSVLHLISALGQTMPEGRFEACGVPRGAWFELTAVRPESR